MGNQCSTLTEMQWEDVCLAVSEFPAAKDWVFLGGQAYHTSVLLGGQEFYFDRNGLMASPKLEANKIPFSHRNKLSTKVHWLGTTSRVGRQLQEKLACYFAPGTYDIIVKNCNDFSDCGLSFLISRRLPKCYSSLETTAKKVPNVLSIASGGRYKVNPAAINFDLEKVVMKVDENAWMGMSEASLLR
jgi:hypothetical protein